MSKPMSKRQLVAVSLAALTAAAVLAGGRAALAYPDAQVESATRPDLGWLLNQPLYGGYGGYGRYGPGYGGYGPAYGGYDRPYGYPGAYGYGWRNDYYGGRELDRIVLDCDGWRGHDIDRAIRHLRVGGTLVLRSHGRRTCNESIYVTRSVEIVGEAGADGFGDWDGGRRERAYPAAKAVLNAPPGQPCISIAPGVHAVSIRGLVINAPEGGGAACIQAHDAEVEIRDTVLRYEGAAPAISVSGGTLRMKHVGLSARTPAPAIVSEGADSNLEDIRLAATQLGLMIEPGPSQTRLLRVYARALDGGSADETHPTTGLMVRGGSGRGEVSVTDTVLLGFSTGARFDHDVVGEMRYGRIGWAKVGVLTDGQFAIKGVSIGASEVGVYARSGETKVIRDRIHGVRYAAIFADNGAKVWAEANYVYPGQDCGFFNDRAYNTTGQECRPWTELPDYLRADRPYEGRFEDGWSEWRYDWGYDWRADSWRTGPGYYDEAAWAERRPLYRNDYGYRGARGLRGGPAPTYAPGAYGDRPAPQSPRDSTDPDRR